MRAKIELIFIRVLDLVISLVAILLFAIPMTLIAILILFSYGRPALFSQLRSGKNLKIFNIWKFRTMKNQGYSLEIIIIPYADQITPLGHHLRRLKLDELPQFFNVLTGQMSMVGPRPQIITMVRKYEEQFHAALQIKPGIFSPASIKYSKEARIFMQSADPEYTYEFVVLPDKLNMDVYLADNFSLLLYLRVLFQGIATILGSKNGVVYSLPQKE